MYLTTVITPHLFQLFGPGLLSTCEAGVKVLGLFEAPKQLFVEGVFLPGADAVAVLGNQRATDGGVEGGDAVS